MKKFVQILALSTIIAVGVLVVLTFVFAFITSPESDAIFTRLVKETKKIMGWSKNTLYSL